MLSGKIPHHVLLRSVRMVVSFLHAGLWREPHCLLEGTMQKCRHVRWGHCFRNSVIGRGADREGGRHTQAGKVGGRRARRRNRRPKGAYLPHCGCDRADPQHTRPGAAYFRPAARSPAKARPARSFRPRPAIHGKRLPDACGSSNLCVHL